jgi:ribonuclease HII
MAQAKDSAPSLRLEAELFAAGATLVAGMDEVGRGALAGPVSVGAVAVDTTVTAVPEGLRDSKLLTPVARERLFETCQGFGVAAAVGHATPAEIDQIGIMGALRRAGNRALAALGIEPDVVLLDGKHDWLTARTLFDAEGYEGSVVTRVKADQQCASVAAASVLAKVTRDAYMVELAKQFPEFGWASNKGYACAEHLTALAKSGPTRHHRRSWRLPEYNGDGG